MKISTLLPGAFLFLLLFVSPAASQVTNLVVNGSSTNFSMTSGDIITWSFDLPAGATAIGTVWADVNVNHVIDPGTDRVLLSFTQTDGDTLGNNGPPDTDGTVDGSCHLSFPLGFAPENYVFEVTHNGSGESVWGVILPLASPAFSVSGTVHGPPTADLSYIVIEANTETNDGPFWHGLTDSLGNYTIELADTAGNPWGIRMNNVPATYIVARQDTPVTIDGHITGIDFWLGQAAAQVVGQIRDEFSNPLPNAPVYVSRNSTSGGNSYYGVDADVTGRFWIGIPLAELNGGSWSLHQPYGDAGITTHMLGRAELGVISDGDSIVHDLVAYTVNASIDGFLQIDGTPPGFEIRIFASNADSGESFTMTDPSTGAFSIPVNGTIADYQLFTIDLFGSYNWPNITVHPGDNGVIYNITTVGVDEHPGLPGAFSLGQNYPNPFNPATIIPYNLPERSNVRLVVYDILGREVATLVNGMEEPGAKTAVLDASRLPSGVYSYRLTANGFTGVKMLMIVR